MSINQRQLLTKIVLGGVISIGSGLLGISAAVAGPISGTTIAQATVETETTTTTTTTSVVTNDITDEVIQTLADRTGRTADTFRVVEYNQELIPNPCIGLAQLGGRCTRAVVRGYRVVVTDGNLNYTYYATRTGDVIALKNAGVERLAQATTQVDTTVQTPVETTTTVEETTTTVETQVPVETVPPAPIQTTTETPIPALW